MAKGNAKPKKSSSRAPSTRASAPRPGSSAELDSSRGSGLPRRWAEALGVCLLAIGALVVGGLFSTQFGDGTLMGQVGAMIAEATFAAFGLVAYLIALGILGLGARALVGYRMELRPAEAFGFVLAILGAAIVLHVSFPMHRLQSFGAGGVLGEVAGEVSMGLVDRAGTYIVGLTSLGLGLLMSTSLSAAEALAHGRRISAWGVHASLVTGRYLWQALQSGAARVERNPASSKRDPQLEETWDWLDEEEAEAEAEDGSWAESTLPESDEAPAKPKAKAKRKRGSKKSTKAKADAANESSDAEEIEWSEEGDEIDVPAPDAVDEAADGTSKSAKSGKRPRARKKATNKSGARAASEVGAEAEVAPGQSETYEAPEIVIPEPAADDDGDDDEQDQAESTPAPTKPARAGKKQAPPRVESLDDLVDEAEPDSEAGDADAEREDLDDSVIAVDESGQAQENFDLGEGDEGIGSQFSDVPDSAEEVTQPKPVRLPPMEVKVKESGGAQAVQYLRGEYTCPPIELFQVSEAPKIEVDRDYVLEQAEKIVMALSHFKIRGKVTKVHPGPVITRYEFKPEAGVKLSRIENLENDLAMALEAMRIRILAPIPGKSTVGFEVPNKHRETVYVQENLADQGFAEDDAKLPLVLGKSITGKPVSIDLGKAPHLLVAGATGSGKSVGVNGMLCSLLFTRSPEDLRLILIDPKMLEFGIYDDIPHLLLPVITDADKASNALRWTVGEMERRYATLSEARVRDIGGYNRKLPELQSNWDAEYAALQAEARSAAGIVKEEGEDAIPGTSLSGVRVNSDGSFEQSFGGLEIEARPERMSYIVVVIDEFADLMMVAGKEVEANVARIAAKARAAGIHLIVATQRPSVDVITGTIKNNFPSRIAFQVTSDIDSRTVLDQKGAKQLLGMGDMLYMDRGKEPVRVHGCFVSEMEIERVVEFVKKQARPAYNMAITVDAESEAEAEEEKQLDALYDKAVQIVAEAQKVSTSMLQRRLNIGYNRAAKIVESMEDSGVIGPARGSQPREVLISAA